jgi:hypothetical protein
MRDQEGEEEEEEGLANHGSHAYFPVYLPLLLNTDTA